MSKHTDEEYRRIAREYYHRDGEVEFDDNAVVSAGDDDGAYVQAWVWIHDNTEETEETTNADAAPEQ